MNMKMNKILITIIVIGIVLYFVISEGYETKKEYDESQIRIAKILNYLRDVSEVDLISIKDTKNGRELILSNVFRTQLIDSIHTVSGYGPGHPVTINVFTLNFNTSEFIVELRHAHIHEEERVYLNVIIEDKKIGGFKESRYSSEELNTWAKDVGIIEN